MERDLIEQIQKNGDAMNVKGTALNIKEMY